MTVKGKLDCYIRAGNTAGSNLSSNEYFVAIINFLDSCGSIGVSRIASNYGVGGTGFGYWDSATPHGRNAWAVYRFGNASTPFNLFVTCVNTTNSSNVSPSSPTVYSSNGYAQSTTTDVGIMLSAALRVDGSNPWAGGTANAGADAKATPFWTPGSSTLLAFPRVNSTDGTYATNREAALAWTNINSGSTNYRGHNFVIRLHLLADENNFLILDEFGLNAYWYYFYFGKYVPLNGLTITTPYVMLANHVQGLNPFVPTGRNWGWPTQQNTTTNCDGGIITETPSNGVKQCYLDYPPTFYNTLIHPNQVVNNSYGRYDMQTVFVCKNDTPPQQGILGTIDFFKTCLGVNTQTTSNDKRLAIFGNLNKFEGKMVVPWNGITTPGFNMTREGIDF